MSKTYTVDDLMQFAKIGRFGSDQTNALVYQLCLQFKQLQAENMELKTKMSEENKSDVKIFGVVPPPSHY